jgi:hypothetical protein
MSPFKPMCIVEIGCPPGSIRPDNILNDIIQDIIKKNTENGLSKNTIENVEKWLGEIKNSTKSFGDFTWYFPSTISESEFEALRTVVMKYFTNYYNTGLLRYASITKE